MITPARLALFLLATAATLFAALTPTAEAWPGSNGHIVFGAYQGGGEFEARGLGLRIASLGASRSGLAPLTEDPGDGEPQGSPDGRLVVFARAASTEPLNREPSRIYVVGVDGSGLRALTDGLHVDREPAFSASGQLVYFTREMPALGGTDIWSVDLAGGSLRRVTSGEGDDFHPRAAPGGRIIAFERRLVGPHSVRYHHIFTARVDGSRVRDLTPKLTNRVTASGPEFSPDGRRLAYSAGDRLISVRPDGSSPRLLIAPRPGADYIFADPTYSPDARSLLFTIATPGGRTSLRRLDLRRLRALPSPIAEPHVGVRSPSWLAVPGR